MQMTHRRKSMRLLRHHSSFCISTGSPLITRNSDTSMMHWANIDNECSLIVKGTLKNYSNKAETNHSIYLCLDVTYISKRIIYVKVLYLSNDMTQLQISVFFLRRIFVPVATSSLRHHLNNSNWIAVAADCPVLQTCLNKTQNIRSVLVYLWRKYTFLWEL